MLKYFTNASEEIASNSIAINPSAVTAVYESKNENGEKVTVIYLQTDIVVTVTDPYLEVVARLSENSHCC